ncbi:MAG: hypothetical protein DDT42_02057 [candidate division WS2 bacterium]|uniref:Uncharacterized protein n=1 Tax=Psychracetigena formicireducens TaxID=2986056 RepID=A0A9E2F798_PSYF1|nr:hypothetical protein [Candidatus Psychracetigena formicireducens]
MPFTYSPGIDTFKLFIFKIVESSIWGFSSVITSSLFSFLPTINSAISIIFVSDWFFSAIFSPSRNTTTRSETWRTSSNRWLINSIDIPLWVSCFKIFSKLPASDSVRTAVGSSNTKTLILLFLDLSTSRAISTNCLYPYRQTYNWQ